MNFVLGSEVIEIIKTASGGTSVGDTVTFTMAVENQGVEELTGVSIPEDTLERLDGTTLTLATGPTFVSASSGSLEGTLAVGETATYEATYVLTQEDVDAGGIRNSAVAEGTDTNGNLFDDISSDTSGVDENPTVVTIAASPSYDFIKESAHDDADGNGRVDAGETINYTFTIENTGNVTLTDVAVTDSRAVLSGSPIAGPLAPGAVDTTTVTGTYTVAQADIDAGNLDNLAEATAKDPAGNDVTRQSRPLLGVEGDPTGVPGFAQIADYDFVKAVEHDDANGNGLFDAGEVLNYTFTVENTGNVSLTNVAVTDSRATVSGSPIAGPLAPGAVDTTSVTGTYMVTQGDIDAGNLDNIASATAKDPGGNDVNKQSRPPSGNPGDPTSPPGGVNQVSDYDFVKDVAHVDADGNGLIDAGEVLDYTFTVENTGNVAVTDSRATVSGSPIATLTPGAVDTTSVTGTYTVTQADIDAGNLDNVASAIAKDPDGNDVTRQSRPPSGNPGDPTRPPGGVTQVADYDFVKEVTHDDADGNGRIDVGEKLDYIFTVANTGNVTLTNVTVTDSRATVSGSPIPSLAPKQTDSTSVTGVYFVTQDDIDAGTIANVADANAKDPNGGDVPKRSRPPGGSPGDSTDLPVDADASVDFVKEPTLNDVNGNGFADAGETVDYAFTVTNTGNVTVSDITVTDGKAEVSGGPISLAPGQVDATSFTGAYTITQADIDSGSFANVATVNGKAPNGDDVTASSRPPDGVPGDASVIPFAPNPAIELELTGSVVDADGDGFPDAGEAVAYVFTVKNTGNVTLSNIAIPSFDVELKRTDFDRYSGSLAVAYKDDDLGLSARIRGEARFERSEDDSRNRNTYVLATGGTWSHDESGRVLANVDAVFSESDEGIVNDGDYVEASMGYAYRPAYHDRLNALLRYTFLYDLPGNDQISSMTGSSGGPLQRSHIVSADLTYDLLPWLSVGGKYGARFGEVRYRMSGSGGGFGEWEDSAAHLGIVRADLHIVKNWDALVEGRAFYTPTIKSADYGFLAALYRHVGNNFKVGAGYNFGRFSDDLRDLTLDDKGPFLNVVGKF